MTGSRVERLRLRSGLLSRKCRPGMQVSQSETRAGSAARVDTQGLHHSRSSEVPVSLASGKGSVTSVTTEQRRL